MWCNGQAPLMLGGGNGSIPFMDFSIIMLMLWWVFIADNVVHNSLYRSHPPAKRLFCAILTVELKG